MNMIKKKKKDVTMDNVVKAVEVLTIEKNYYVNKAPFTLTHVYHTGANIGYYHRVLDLMEKKFKVACTLIRLDEYIAKGNPPTDFLSYQTFPDENQRSKFNPDLVKLGDTLFQKFTGHKILFDANDSGEVDSFSRFKDSKELPRIKSFPSKWFLNNYNIILPVSFAATDHRIWPDEFERTIKISCKFGGYSYFHKIRESVVEQLNAFFPGKVDFKRVEGRVAYTNELKHTLIAIGAPGWGQYSATHHCALRTGALLFAHESIKDIKWLTHANLTDGIDFVSYNLYNFKFKLQRLLDSPNTIEDIRKAGRETITLGYDLNKSADDFYNYLHKNSY